MGQQEQQTHPCSENSSVCSCTHSNALELTPLCVYTHIVFFLLSLPLSLVFLVSVCCLNCALLLCSASSLLCERGRNPKRKQPDQYFHWWQNVLLEPGHALPATGTLNLSGWRTDMLSYLYITSVICVYHYQLLRQPVWGCLCSSLQDSLELVFKQSKAVAVTSMAFPLGDVNNFVVGSEDGSVYTACRHGRWVLFNLWPH